jgi:hypothetical protein
VPVSLPVDLNTDRLHEIDAPPTFVATDSFTVDLRNRGEAAHVHLHLDDDLSRVARLSTNNHYVEAETTRPVEVTVRPVTEPTTGKLKVVTGYGNETEYVEVTVEPPTEEKQPVQVDERLSKPQRPEPEPTWQDRVQSVVEESELPVVVLAVLAIVLALAVGIVANSAVVLLAAGVVVLGVVAALIFLLQ